MDFRPTLICFHPQGIRIDLRWPSAMERMRIRRTTGEQRGKQKLAQVLFNPSLFHWFNPLPHEHSSLTTHHCYSSPLLLWPCWFVLPFGQMPLILVQSKWQVTNDKVREHEMSAVIVCPAGDKDWNWEGVHILSIVWCAGLHSWVPGKGITLGKSTVWPW